MASAHGHAVRSRANDGDEPVRVLPMRARRRSEVAGEIARYLGAVSILVVGAVHAQQYYGAYFSVVPTIGTLFLLSFIGSGAVGVVLLAPVRRLGRDIGDLILVDARGRTLYLFEKDHNGKSACNTACVKFWPPLTSGAQPRAGTGVHKSLLGVTKRQDGRRQVTYAGHPLYTFVGDQTAGQTKGEGQTNFGAEWYALAATGRTVEPSKPSGGGYGSGGGW